MTPTGDHTDEPDAATIEAGRLLFAKECLFVMGVAKPEQIPATSLPEIAFAGRSNVGKSSLINALTNHKSLARTSNTPGRTQEVNFFNLGERLMIADLPGYGYAKVSKSRVKQWTGLVNTYLKGRAQLRRTCLLIDARHGLMDSDRKVMSMLDTAAVSYQIILTKADKASAGSLEKLLAGIQSEAANHTALFPVAIPTSSRKGHGIERLRAELSTLALPGV
ncbi:MAG: YihA family ribosome biogenesis GTP-binding protein [Rhodospirillales bacterium]|nr:YihA family ribosome biogenesis GTP-binding protein [Rhodospirillales bacterium]